MRQENQQRQVQQTEKHTIPRTLPFPAQTLYPTQRQSTRSVGFSAYVDGFHFLGLFGKSWDWRCSTQIQVRLRTLWCSPRPIGINWRAPVLSRQVISTDQQRADAAKWCDLHAVLVDSRAGTGTSHCHARVGSVFSDSIGAVGAQPHVELVLAVSVPGRWRFDVVGSFVPAWQWQLLERLLGVIDAPCPHRCGRRSCPHMSSTTKQV